MYQRIYPCDVKQDCILIRYGEIALKGKFTRQQFEKKLRNNIRKALISNNIHFSLIIIKGRIIIKTNHIEKAIAVLSHVFGIISLSPSFIVPTDLLEISKFILLILDNNKIKTQRFALRVNRVGSHPFSGQDVAIQVGSYIQKHTNLPVDLTDPDIEIFIEIRDNQTLLFLEKIPGPGGMPMGTQGNTISIIDTASDLLAAWYLLKRGCDMVFVYSKNQIIKEVDLFFTQWHIPKNIIHIQKGKDFWNQINKIITTHHIQAFCSAVTLDKNNREPIDLLTSLEKQITIPILTPLISFNHNKIKQLCKEKGITL
jgi:thiamine biosynthesis protein ThiI